MTGSERAAAPRGSPFQNEILIDVSRLVWRVWRGKLPTGVDRVCIAYLEQFGSRALAVVQRSGLQFVLSREQSKRLFAILLEGGSSARGAMARLLVTIWKGASRTPPRRGMLYLNVGHTGLDEAALPRWIAANELRAVYLVHDLIPLTHPEYCRSGEAGKHQRRMNNVLASASGIIGNSRATLDDLAAFAAAQGTSMPPAIAVWISGKAIAGGAVPRTLSSPFFVTIGTIEARKNHLLLLDVWRELVAEMTAKAPTLVIVGQRGWEAAPALAILDQPGDLNGHVLELGRCGDEELAGWIAGAEALLMPSFAEGFGLPVIEALQLGTPVIASDLPVFREIAGDIPAYLDPRDHAGWKSAIRTFAKDRSEGDRQRALMAGWRAPDWNGHFDRVEKWLATL